MSHTPKMPVSYPTRSYGKKSHFPRNLIIVIIILFFLPGTPAFFANHFSVQALFTAASDFWTQVITKFLQHSTK